MVQGAQLSNRNGSLNLSLPRVGCGAVKCSAIFGGGGGGMKSISANDQFKITFSNPTRLLFTNTKLKSFSSVRFF